MKIFTSVQVKGFRSIQDSGVLPLGPITLVIGQNNVGKSSLLRAIYSIQEGSGFQFSDRRINDPSPEAELNLWFDRLPATLRYPERTYPESKGVINCKMRPQSGVGTVRHDSAENEELAFPAVPNREPGNLIYPIFSGRRQQYYQEQVSTHHAFVVSPSDSNLVSRVSTLATGQFAEAIEFRRLCKEILGIDLSVLVTENNQQLGIQLNRSQGIPLEAMGSGISSALSALVSLSGAKEKLFLIEEPENDLHPNALKKLLDKIIEASSENQFIVTTHSSIVLAKLGSTLNSVVLHAQSDFLTPPTSTYEVIDSPQQRLGVLQELGYEFSDLELGEGWLIFEESSAELIVREWLIPWFAPELRRLRTLGATGVNRVEPLMLDFKEMFLFAHLEQVYRGRAWVIVDGDEIGQDVTQKLRATFKGWPEDRFTHWERHNFEEYYPPEFQEAVSKALSIPDRRKKREAKKALLRDVLDWTRINEERAREEFSVSAAEVIEKLLRIEAEVKKLGFAPVL